MKSSMYCKESWERKETTEKKSAQRGGQEEKGDGGFQRVMKGAGDVIFKYRNRMSAGMEGGGD